MTVKLFKMPTKFSIVWKAGYAILYEVGKKPKRLTFEEAARFMKMVSKEVKK